MKLEFEFGNIKGKLYISLFQTGVIFSSSPSSKSSSPSWSESIIPVEVPNTSLTSFSSYTLKNLDNETVYDVRVKALNGFGSSKFSKVFNFYVKASGKNNVNNYKVRFWSGGDHTIQD